MPDKPARPRVVIVGGGFGGLAAARALKRANVDLTGGLIFSQQALLALVEAGMGRQQAYKVVQEAAMRAWSGLGLQRGSPNESCMNDCATA